MDLVWPPPDADLDACAVVHLDGGDRPGGDRPAAAPPQPAAEPAAEPAALADAAAPISLLGPRRRLKPTFGDCRDPGVAPRIRPLVVPVEPPPLPIALAGPVEGAEERPEERPDVLAADDLTPDEYEDDDEGLADEPMVLFPLVPAEAADPEVAGASRSAWLAVFFAAACAIVTVVEYGVIFSLPAEVGTSAAEQPPAPDGVSATDLAPGLQANLPVRRSAERPDVQPALQEAMAAQSESRAGTAAEPSRPAVTLITQATPAPEPIARTSRPPEPRPRTPEPTPVTAEARSARQRPAVSAAPIPAPASPRQPAAARVVAPPPAESRVAVHVVNRGTVPVAAPEPRPVTPVRQTTTPPAPQADTPAVPSFASASPAPAPMASSAAASTARERIDGGDAIGAPRPVAAVLTETTNADEEDIRSTLKRFRTAYSQLNARAARDVWPSVDTRALERAFQSLKSQELRFDRCNLTVTGEKAQAACTGRATYVPRIGDQSPRFTTREWTFELRKADERWTIASARTL